MKTLQTVLDYVVSKRGGSYVHALEVENVYDLQMAYECLYDELIREFSNLDVFEFLASMSVYCLDESQEEEVYGFDIEGFLLTLS